MNHERPQGRRQHGKEKRAALCLSRGQSRGSSNDRPETDGSARRDFNFIVEEYACVVFFFGTKWNFRRRPKVLKDRRNAWLISVSSLISCFLLETDVQIKGADRESSLQRRSAADRSLILCKKLLRRAPRMNESSAGRAALTSRLHAGLLMMMTGSSHATTHRHTCSRCFGTARESSITTHDIVCV